jgi:hypothetical protein
MRKLRVTMTIRHLMVAVAFVALMIPFPVDAVFGLIPLFLVVWFPTLCVVTMISEFVKAKWLTAIVLALGTAGLSFTFLPARPFRDPRAFAYVVLVLTPLNLLGPFHLARRLRQRSRLASGELLWSWEGLLWSVLMWSCHPHSQWEVLALMGQFARMSFIVAVLLAEYGHRPAPSQPRWAHHTGWALLECDVLVWGWYAARFLR